MNWIGKIADFFVKNGRLSLLLVIALFAWGIISFMASPKQYNPQITAPSFKITVDFPGASKNEVLEQVTKPLENIVSDIPGVEDIFSYTSPGGTSVVTVNFDVGEDPDYAKITLNDRIQSNFDVAPLGLKDPLIQSIDPDDIPVLTIALASHAVDPISLRKFGFKLRDQLRTIEGASNIEVVGGRKQELSILIDPIKLKKERVGITSIEAALQRSNLYLPSGIIKQTDEFIPIETTSIITQPDDLKGIVVTTGDFGQITINDLATIKAKQKETEEYIRHIKYDNGKTKESNSLVLLSIAKLKGTNISEITGRIKKTLGELDKNFIPDTISTEIIVNEGDTASNEIEGLVTNLFTSILIVVLILLLFLDFRAALLVAISIPLTLACVFGVGLLAGQNINRITLFALILSLGLLVDSATVVIENIVRRLSLKKKKEDESKVVVSAVNEVGMGLFMSTVTTVLAFIPMAFVTGMMGPYMGPIPFFLPAALIISLIIALSVNPWMASVLLKKKNKTGILSIPKSVNKIFTHLKEYINAVFEKYHSYLHSILYNSKKRKLFLTLVAFLVVISLTLPAVKLVKFRMLPKADKEQFYLYLDMPAGTPLDKTLAVTKKFEAYLLQQKHIIMVQSYTGHPPILDFNGMFRGASNRRMSHQSTIRVGLTKPGKRNIKSETIVLNLRPKLYSKLGEFSPDKKIKIKLVEDPPGPPVLSTFLVRIQGNDEAYLQKIARELLPKINAIGEVVDTDTSAPDDTKTVQLRVKHKRASMSRIEPVRIVQTLNTAFSGKILGIYHNQNNIEQEYITLRLEKKYRTHKKFLKDIYIFNDRGIGVPLLKLAEIITTDTVKPTNRENRKNTVYIYGDMGSRSVTYAAIDFLFSLYKYSLPDNKGTLTGFNLFGATYKLDNGQTISIKLGGEWELTLEVFRDLGIAMAIAVFLIYFVLVAQFSSYKEPMIIMSTIPLSLIGVLPGFMILGLINDLYFSATSMIGVIALAGIAVNNSIILLEYLNSLKTKGMGLEDALLEAVRVRFRPIMLTTITTMLGSVTIAGDPVWSGLAWSIIFGLGVSSLLTLLVFPTMYYLLRGKGWKRM